jgi:hypothetical protein
MRRKNILNFAIFFTQKFLFHKGAKNQQGKRKFITLMGTKKPNSNEKLSVSDGLPCSVDRKPAGTGFGRIKGPSLV